MYLYHLISLVFFSAESETSLTKYVSNAFWVPQFYFKKLYIGERHMQTITVSLEICEWAHIVMTLYQQTYLPWLSSLWHIITVEFSLERNHSFSYTETMVVEQRHIVLTGTFPQHIKECRVNVKINPKQPLPGRKSDYFLDDQRSAYNQSNLPTYYVITGLTNLTWNQAEDICQTEHAHLPYLKSDLSWDWVESLLFRSVETASWAKRHSYFPVRCRRLGPLCGVFVGLSGKMVSMTNQARPFLKIFII